VDSCLPRNSFVATVSSVSDGRTLVLADGREVRLAAIETPGAWARDALPALLAGPTLTFSPFSPRPDRYGRIAARAFVVENGVPRPLETELVAKGLAFVGMAEMGSQDRACLASLRAAESTARANKLGLWADPDYDTKATDNPAAILGAKGRFAIIEGKVLSVRESGGTVYINFGRRWSEDFTVTILKRITAKFVAAGIDPKRLEGRRVRIRGFVEERGGPWIEATTPEQIEIAEGR
jgi:endonuclease YncB( thermonuclease family)